MWIYRLCTNEVLKHEFRWDFKILDLVKYFLHTTVKGECEIRINTTTRRFSFLCALSCFLQWETWILNTTNIDKMAQVIIEQLTKTP